MCEPKKNKNYKYIRREPYLFGFRSDAFIGLICTLFLLLFSLAFLYHIIIWDIIVVISCFLAIIYFRFLYGKDIQFLSKNIFPKELNEFTKDTKSKEDEK
ncbi:MAG: hypothetical protein RL662_2183 [Bacteroidota bacterium]|jgi:Ca2+/Na+ antiporter